MSVFRTLCLSTSLLTVLAAEANAASYGYVYLVNNTSKSFTVESSNWVDIAGKTVSKKITWKSNSKEKVRLTFNKKNIYASSFQYRMKTFAGTTPTDPKRVWEAKYISGGKILVSIYDSKLPKTVIVRKPVYAGKTAKGRRYFDARKNAVGVLGFAHPTANYERLTYLGTGGVRVGGRLVPGDFHLKYRYDWKSGLNNKRHSTTILYFFKKNGSFSSLSASSTTPVRPFAFSTLILKAFTQAMKNNKKLNTGERLIVNQLAKKADGKAMVEFLIKVDLR